jgi:branched-chain amino acid transport system ATP-binding protein
MNPLQVRGVAKSFGGVRALAGIDLELRPREIFGLIGPNGSGKSTLVNVVSGFIAPDAGDVSFDGHRISGLPHYRIARAGLGRTFQNLRISKRRTVLENVMLGQTPVIGRLDFLMPVPTSRQRAQHEAARAMLARFGLAGKSESIAGTLSFGDQKRLELARAMAGSPSALLLDEPAGGMNPSEIDELRELLRQLRDEGLAILVIEHNMRLMMQVCDRMAVLASGELIMTGSPEEVRRDERVIRSYLGED